MVDVKWKIFALTFVTYSMIHGVRTSWSSLKYTLNSPPYSFSPVFLGTLDMSVLIALAVSLNLFGPRIQQFGTKNILLKALIGLAIIMALLGFLLLFKIQYTTFYAIIYPFAGVISFVGWPASMLILSKYFQKGMIFSIWIGSSQFGDLITLSISYIIVEQIDANAGIFLLVIAALLVGVYFLDKYFLIFDEEPNDPNIPQQSPGNLQNNNVQLVQQAQRPSSYVNMAVTGINTVKKRVNFLTVWTLPEVPAYLISYLFIKSVYAIISNWLVYYLSMIGMKKEARIIAILWAVSTFIGGLLGSYFNPHFKKNIFIICLFVSAFLFVFMEEIHIFPNEIQIIFLIISCGLAFGGPYTLITTSIPIYLSQRPAIKAFPGAKAAIISAMEGYGLLSCGISVLIIPTIGVIDMHWFNFSYCLIAASILLTYHLKEIEQNHKKEKSKRFIMTQKDVKSKNEVKFNQSLPNLTPRKEVLTERQYKRKRLTKQSKNTKIKANLQIYTKKESQLIQQKSENIKPQYSNDLNNNMTQIKQQKNRFKQQINKQKIVTTQIFKFKLEQEKIQTNQNNFQQQNPQQQSPSLIVQKSHKEQEEFNNFQPSQIASQF